MAHGKKKTDWELLAQAGNFSLLPAGHGCGFILCYRVQVATLCTWSSFKIIQESEPIKSCNKLSPD